MATNNKPANQLRCGNIESDNLGEHQRKGSVLFDDLLPPIQGSVWRMAQWDIVWSQRP